MLTYATTFSGIGGWELGLNACGWDLKWQCERDPFCQQLLQQRFGVPIYDDITTILTTPPERVDALIGSPPCQPFSVAGEGRGTGDERHLYPSFIKLVSYIKPRWVLMEQVPAILTNDGGRAFGLYVGGLAALGYDLVWHCIPAIALGSDIERDRLWIIARANGEHGKAGMGNLAKRKSSIQLYNPAERLPFWVQTTGQFIGVGDGFSDQFYSDRVSAIGNAVVPQIPQIIGQAINEVEALNH